MQVGLYNLGNTCFLNAVLQSLRKCESFVDAVSHTSVTRPESKKGPLVSAFQGLLSDMKSSTGPYTPTKFVQTMVRVIRDCEDDWYQPRQQADAAECTQYILDSLHDALYRSVRITIHGVPKSKEEGSHVKAVESWRSFFAKEYSPIVEHFQGQTQICVECQTCKSVSERYEPWMMIKAPIPGGHKDGANVPSFQQCLDAAYAAETIEGYACDTCKSPQTAVIRTRISKFPNTLILTFKRFTNQGAKIRGEVTWDLDAMNLRPWAAFTRCPFSDRPLSTTYRTFAVIEHCGSSRGGHYMMYSREGDSWYEYDDESVRKVSSVITADSYVVFAEPV